MTDTSSCQTSRIVIRSGGKHKAFYQVTRANMRHGKAVYNETLFCVRNLFTGLRKSPEKQTENEKKVIADVCAAITDINEKRIQKGKEPYHLPEPKNPYLSKNLWTSVMGRILKDCLPRPESFYSKLEQNTIRAVCDAMTSFFKAKKDYQEHPEKYQAAPHLPRYLKTDTFTLNYDYQMIKTGGTDKRHTIALGAVKPVIKTGKKKFENIVNVRLAYRNGEIIASICMKTEEAANENDSIVGAQNNSEHPAPDPERVLGIDLGVKNFITICSGFGDTPIIIRGGKLKAENQYFNKQRALWQSHLKKHHDSFNSRRLEKFGAQRENFIFNYFHQAAVLIVNYALQERAGTIVVGRNKGWKQNINNGKENNQKFVAIPFHRFVRILTDKAAQNGIQVICREESYTSHASAIDRDDIPCYQELRKLDDKEVWNSIHFSGRRVERGMYVSSDGTRLNGDVNGAANIIRKYKESALQKDLRFLSGPIRMVHVA